MPTSSTRSTVLCAMLVLSFAGCGGSAEPKREFADIKGKVTYKGEALKTGTVTFQPATGAAASGQIQADGTYSLKGVVGPNKVTIVSRDAAEETPPNPETRAANAAKGPPKEYIPAKYGTSESGLSYDVKAGEQTKDFELQ